MRLRHKLVCISCFSAVVAGAQPDVFTDPGFTGATQSALWDNFVFASGGQNPPDAGSTGPFASLLQRNNAIIATSGNIYSFSNNLDVVLSAAAEQPLDQLVLQLRFLGQEDAVSSLVLQPVGGGAARQPDTLEEVFREAIPVPIPGQESDAFDLAFRATWDLRGLAISDYTITFEVLVHTSLDAVRLDTQADLPNPALELTPLGGGFRLRFATQAGYDYRIEQTGDLIQWTPLGADIPGDGAPRTLDVQPPPLGTAVYYRVRIL